jgi:hypothetical protein
MGLFAHGTQMSIDSTPIGGLRQISFPTEEKALVETTDHDSGGDREYVPGLRDGGTVDLEYLTESTDDGQQALWANYGSATNAVASFVITVPGNPDVTSDEFTLSFQGFVTSRGGSLPFDEVASQTTSIKITGPVTHSLVSV